MIYEYLAKYQHFSDVIKSTYVYEKMVSIKMRRDD